jgi:hypothetical protein
MRSRLAAILSLIVVLGCVSEAHLPYKPVPVSYDNPVLLRIANHELVWDGIVDVVSDYFRIEREDPVRLLGNTLTVGRIDTFPKPGATLLEPWDHDSANSYDRLESTLQSIRRYAVVKVIPAQNGGFWVDLAVFKELENVRQPEHATAGSAIFRNDISPNHTVTPDLPTRSVNPDLPNGTNQSWIPQGRDTAAEQRILGQILDRFTPQGTPLPVNY